MEENKKLIKEIQNILKKKKIKGYDPYFLGSEIPVPYILPELSKDILYLKNTSDWLPKYLPPIKDGMSLRYSNFTIVMNKKNRMAMYVALNIDRKQKKKKISKSTKFRTDPRIGNDSQLNNAYYRNNPWDRGHLARLEMARWGENKILADIALKHTFYYTNICPQHDKFNKDEWVN